MTSVTYSEIFSRFYLKVEAYDLFDSSVTDEMRNDFLCGYLHSAISKPYTRRLFSSIQYTDTDIYEDVEGTIEFTMKYSVDDNADEDFVKEILAMGMVLEWVEPKVKSLTHMRRMISTSDEKFYAESTFLTSLMSLQESTEAAQKNLIDIRGFINNDYLDGNAATASLRS